MNLWLLRALLPVALAALLGVTASTAQCKDGDSTLSPSFVLGEGNTVQLPATATTLTATGIAGLDALGTTDVEKLARTLTISDRGVARGVKATGSFELSQPEFVGRSGTDGLIWSVPVQADVPAGTSQVRVASVAFGAHEPSPYALVFTVSAKAAATAAQWTPHGATNVWTVSWSDQPDARVYGIAIENPGEPIIGLRLAQSTLKDEKGHLLGVDRLRLVASPDGTEQTRLDVPGSSTQTFYLRIQDGKPVGPFGTFDGAVRLTADGNSAMKDVSLKVQASSNGRRWLGVALTVAGLLLTLILTALLRPLMARLQARRAAMAVRHGIDQFLDELNRTLPPDIHMASMKEVAERYRESITDSALATANLLPPRIALGPCFDAIPDTTTTLKAKLDEVSKVLEGLLILLRVGVPPILQLMTAPDKGQTACAFATELDGLADVVTNAQDARTKVEALRQRVLDARGTERSAAAPPSIRDVTVSDLDFQIGGLSLLAWSIWGVIAVVIGAAWIFNNPAFGTTLDLVSSFAWGFGITTFGGGIQNLTPASVATHMNVKIPS